MRDVQLSDDQPERQNGWTVESVNSLLWVAAPPKALRRMRSGHEAKKGAHQYCQTCINQDDGVKITEADNHKHDALTVNSASCRSVENVRKGCRQFGGLWLRTTNIYSGSPSATHGRRAKVGRLYHKEEPFYPSYSAPVKIYYLSDGETSANSALIERTSWSRVSADRK